jgi:tetratricopeptide (TPR) repeat protein
MSSLPSLFIQAGYPAFPLDEYGFPQLGPVIKYFRKKMVYTDLDGCERRWRQLDLANALGLSEDMVGLMETQNFATDSISRRRALADTLKIPPIFLGIGTLADLEAFLRGDAATQLQTSTLHENEIHLYEEALAVHWNMFYAGTLQDLPTLQYWSQRLELAASEHSTFQRPLEGLICGYYQLLATIHADKRKFAEVWQYLDDALDIASAQGNKSLQAAIYYRYVKCRLEERRFPQAKAPADMALSLVQDVDKSLQQVIYQHAGLTYALTAQDKKDRAKATKLLDLAGSIAKDKNNMGQDTHVVRSGPGRYALGRADTLITLGELTEALTELDEADDLLPFDQRKRRGYMDILRGEAYIKKMELDTATSYLQSAFATSSTIHSEYNIGYIARLCKLLSESSYGSSPDVARLKRSLREYQSK